MSLWVHQRKGKNQVHPLTFVKWCFCTCLHFTCFMNMAIHQINCIIKVGVLIICCDISLNCESWIINTHIIWKAWHSYYNTSISWSWSQSKSNAYCEIFVLFNKFWYNVEAHHVNLLQILTWMWPSSWLWIIINGKKIIHPFSSTFILPKFNNPKTFHFPNQIFDLWHMILRKIV